MADLLYYIAKGCLMGTVDGRRFSIYGLSGGNASRTDGKGELRFPKPQTFLPRFFGRQGS